MWRAPGRPNHEVSQTYNDGVVTVYRVADCATPGDMPKIDTEKCAVLHYEERRMGVTRYYAAAQSMAQVERVLRVPRRAGIDAQMLAITEDGRKYRIDLVQAVTDVFPPSLDLTLSRVTHDAEAKKNAMV